METKRFGPHTALLSSFLLSSLILDLSHRLIETLLFPFPRLRAHLRVDEGSAGANQATLLPSVGNLHDARRRTALSRRREAYPPPNSLIPVLVAVVYNGEPITRVVV